jgi:hypothetical protein
LIIITVLKHIARIVSHSITLTRIHPFPSITSFAMYYYNSASILVNQVMENSRSIESLDGYQKRKVTKKPLFQRLLERAQADEERAMRKKVGFVLYMSLCIVSFFVFYIY